MALERCPLCQSDRIIHDCQLSGDAETHRVKTTVDTGARGAPDSWWDKRPVVADVKRCHVCGSCGFVMPAIEEPEKLWAAYQAATRSG